MAPRAMTFVTDYGSASGYPAQVKGVILGLCPGAVFVDITHDIPPFQILLGQWVLRGAVASFPAGTIHLAIVDPGVGSARRPLVVEGGVRAPGHFFLGPDNGILSPWFRGGRVFEIANPVYRLPEVSATFHGRDVFAPAAAHLASGAPIESFGPEVIDPVKLASPRVRREGGAIVGEVLFADSFGNLVTNLGAADLPQGDRSHVKVFVAGRTIAGILGHYAEVERGEPLALVGSWGLLEIAVREGSAERLFSQHPAIGMPVVIEWTTEGEPTG